MDLESLERPPHPHDSYHYHSHSGLTQPPPDLSPLVDTTNPIAIDLSNEIWLQANNHSQNTDFIEPPYHTQIELCFPFIVLIGTLRRSLRKKG